MNGFRVARNYIKRTSDDDLQGLYEAAKRDTSYEAMVVTHLIKCEMNERQEKHMKELLKALRTLGVGGSVTTSYISIDRIAVYIDDEYFGVWDTERKTFVD